MQAALVAEYSDTMIAIDRFEAKARKGDSAAVYGMGRMLLRQGNLPTALPYLQEAARLESGSPFVLGTLGAAYFQQGKLAEAQKVLRTALLLNPSAYGVHYRLALVLIELGQKEEALEHLQQIENLAHVFLDIDYQLGVVLGRLTSLDWPIITWDGIMSIEETSNWPSFITVKRRRSFGAHQKRPKRLNKC